MKKTKILSLALLLICFTMILTACVDIKGNIVIDEESGGTFAIAMEMEESVYNMILSEEPYYAQQLRESGLELETFEKEDKKYVRFFKQVECVTYQELCEGIKGTWFPSFDIQQNAKKDKWTVSGTVDLSKEFPIEDAAAYSMAMSSFTFVFEMPGPIEKMEGCAEEGENSRTFELDLKEILLYDADQKATFRVVCEEGMPLWLLITLIAGGSVLILAGVTILLVLIIKKKKKQEMAVQNEVEETACNVQAEEIIQEASVTEKEE